MKGLVRVLFIICCLSNDVVAQNEGNVWLLGSEIWIQQPDDPRDSVGGGTSIDFNYEPMKMYRDKKRLHAVGGGNASICDHNGKLLAWSNGQTVIDGQNRSIVDTINYDADLFPEHCREWPRTVTDNDTISVTDGVLGLQRVLILPMCNNQYYAIYNSLNFCDIANALGPKYTKFYVDGDTSFLIKMDESYRHPERFSWGLFAVRHGNGRDWWLLAANDKYKSMVTFLVDDDGIHYHNKTDALMVGGHYGSVGQIAVSNDGSYIVWHMKSGNEMVNGGGFNFGRFDRCSGTITDIRGTYLPWTILGVGVAFSSDSKNLYVCTRTSIYQYPVDAVDLKAAEKKVADYDGFGYMPTANSLNYPVDFNMLQPGIDGRIYIFPTSAENRYFSVINYPNEKGESCDLRQHAFKSVTPFARTVPNIPNFRLGPLDGSPCDTLGLDNHPIAKYRYEPDSINPFRIRFTDLSYFRPEVWSWDYGDGSPKEGTRSPYHTFVQNGTYRVCLTVSNENSSNMSCRDIVIGPSSVDGAAATETADVTFFPNPVQDQLLLTLGDYIPIQGQISIYTLSGQQIHRQRLYYGHNNVDVSGLAAGMYIVRLTDGDKVIKEEKVVKTE